MSELIWDADGDRFYETGVDRGVLYIPTGGDISLVTRLPEERRPNDTVPWL